MARSIPVPPAFALVMLLLFAIHPAAPLFAEDDPVADLRRDSLASIAKTLKTKTDALIVDLLIDGQAKSVDLCEVDADKNLVYKAFGKKSQIAYADLTASQLAGILVALANDEKPTAAADHLNAGLLYMLDSKSSESAAEIAKAVQLDDALDAVAKTKMQALPKPKA
ncbi:MAG TPA: hypothetical protein VL860_07610, partial [Planctomycetota bacterium]|nr:hypothetical protein [Planctomycetota bacterium]